MSLGAAPGGSYSFWLSLFCYLTSYFCTNYVAALFFCSYDTSKYFLRQRLTHDIPDSCIHLSASSIGELVSLGYRAFSIIYDFKCTGSLSRKSADRSSEAKDADEALWFINVSGRQDYFKIRWDIWFLFWIFCDFNERGMISSPHLKCSLLVTACKP